MTDAIAENKPDFMDAILGPEKPEEEAAAEQETEEETKPAAKEQEKEEEPDKKVLVPHQAFHEERERRKELQKQLAEAAEREKRWEERMSKLMDMQAKKPEEEQFVDPLQRIETKVNEVVDKVNKTQEQTESEKKATAEHNAFMQRYTSSVNDFTKATPDFTEAYNFLINARGKELADMGLNRQEIAQQLAQDEKLIVSRAFENEKNPGEVLYSLSKGRGYQAKEKAPQKKTVEDIDKGLKASKSLGSGGTKAGDKDDLESLSPADLADMSQDEFDSFFAKMEKQANRRQ